MSLIQPHRRWFLKGLGLLIAAPAIVRASSIMPVRSYVDIGDRSTYVTYGNEIFVKGDDWTIEFWLVKGRDQHGNWREEKISRKRNTDSASAIGFVNNGRFTTGVTVCLID